MKTTTISMVIPPHDVRDTAKLDSLIAAYQSDAAVTPVVILDMGSACYAICGSHRIAAAREVYASDADVEECLGWIVEDGSDVYARCGSEAREMIDALMSGSAIDYSDLVSALLADDVLCGDSDAALSDQVS